MSDYLEEAAAELRKAREDNEKRAALVPSLQAGSLPTAGITAGVNGRRMELAEGFTRLAAIERNLPPCCHAVRPEPEQETSS